MASVCLEYHDPVNAAIDGISAYSGCRRARSSYQAVEHYDRYRVLSQTDLPLLIKVTSYKSYKSNLVKNRWHASDSLTCMWTKNYDFDQPFQGTLIIISIICHH